MDLQKIAQSAVRIVLATAWALLGVFVLTGTVVESPLRAPAKQRQQIISWTPQGWAFFTRSPRTPVLRVYRRVEGAWRNASISNASYQNLFGVSRRARAINAELGAISVKIPRRGWTPCAESLSACAATVSLSEPTRVTNPSLHPELCGNLMLEQRPLVPWAWSASRERIFMPGLVAFVLVECHDER